MVGLKRGTYADELNQGTSKEVFKMKTSFWLASSLILNNCANKPLLNQ